MLPHVLQCTGQPPRHKDCLVQNIDSAEAEKPGNTSGPATERSCLGFWAVTTHRRPPVAGVNHEPKSQ